MDIVVLSGKGGTGKTTLSVNLAAIAGDNTSLLDCDVEEPNSHLFIEDDFKDIKPVKVNYPVIDEDKCRHCGKCGEFCSFHAILNTKKMNIIMPELCHDCGGCKIICPSNAISFGSRETGKVRTGAFNRSHFFADGELNTGEFSTTKIIHNVLKEGRESRHRIIDAPPGCACAATETAEGADFAVIVTEPTPFALSDMKMVVEMLEKLEIKTGVVINKSGEDEKDLLEYCNDKKIPILGRIPFSVEYGKSYAMGKILVNEFQELKIIFEDIWRKIENEC